MCIYNSNHPFIKIIKGYILHCTSPKNYKKICKDGYIKVNKGNFSYTWEQTQGSCVHKIKGISLLDFGLPEDKIFFVNDQPNFDYPWTDILLAHKPLTVIIKLNRENLINKLLTWEDIRKKTEKCLLIPYTEVCSLEPIPTKLFEGLVLIQSFSKFEDVTNGYLSKELLEKI